MSHEAQSSSQRYWAVALCALCAFAYLPAWQAFFVKDDIILATSAQLNLLAALQHSWPGGFFRPAAELLFAAQHMFFGLHPFPYHLVSFTAHMGSVYFAYRLFYLLPQSRPAALLAAGIFALHPLNTETVSWISGQMSLFASLCILASISLSATDRRIATFIPVLVLGIGFYESSLLGILLWFAFCLYDERFRPSLHPVPILLIGACLTAYLYWRFFVLDLGGGNYQTTFALKTCLLNAVYYLYLLAGGSAIGARILHYQPDLISTRFLDVFTPLLLVNTLLILTYGFHHLRRRQWPGFDTLMPFAWLAITLLPTLFLSERPRRLSYLAVPGFSLAISQIWYYLQEKARPGAMIARTGLALYILVLASTLYLRNYDWQEAGDLERTIPKAIDSDCRTLFFDMPNLVGDALFFNSLSTAKWLSLNEVAPVPTLHTPTDPAWNYRIAKPGCYYLFVDGTISPAAKIKPQPTFSRGSNWVYTR